MFKFLLVFHWNYICISNRFWHTQRQIIAWPWNLVRGHSRSEIIPFNRSQASSYWGSIVTIGLSCIISEIKRNIGRKSWFFIHYFIRRDRNITISFGEKKTRIMWLLDGEKRWRILRICVYSFWHNTRTWQTPDRRTDRQTDTEWTHDSIGRAYV